MYIWHEDLIPKLCDNHLRRVWRDSWLTYAYIIAIMNEHDLNAQEFKNAPLHLVYRMNIIYNQLKRRELKIKGKYPSPFEISDTPFTQMIKEFEYYVPYILKQEQIAMLKKNCKKCLC